jgi:hypothetical protein
MKSILKKLLMSGFSPDFTLRCMLSVAGALFAFWTVSVTIGNPATSRLAFLTWVMVTASGMIAAFRAKRQD